MHLIIGLGMRTTGGNVRAHSVMEMAAIVGGDVGGEVMPFEAAAKLDKARHFDVIGKGLLTHAVFEERCRSGATVREIVERFEGWINDAVRGALKASTVTLVVNGSKDLAFLLDLYGAAHAEPGVDGIVDLGAYFMGVVGTSSEFATTEHIIRHLESPDNIPLDSALHRAAFAAGAFHSLQEWRTTRVTYDPTADVGKKTADAVVAAKPAPMYVKPRAATMFGMPAVILPVPTSTPVMEDITSSATVRTMPKALRPTTVQPKVDPVVIGSVVDNSDWKPTMPATEATRKVLRTSDPDAPSIGAYRGGGSEDRLEAVQPQVARMASGTRSAGVVEEQVSSDPRADGAIRTFAASER